MDRRPGIQIGRGSFMIYGHIDSAETVMLIKKMSGKQ